MDPIGVIESSSHLVMLRTIVVVVVLMKITFFRYQAQYNFNQACMASFFHRNEHSIEQRPKNMLQNLTSSK